ncbi:hypothetical protein Mp_5g20150 [Marchantia polymorpha subsp. ruderalis]|uniref:Uncharacterized protein n=2 Tax=Marchantia polymorpha TaxID=3197 RepID=A0AAF6BKB5_MARPO|nr:hypothetical protein MARPO_0190s0011 [Marchantia polymorpha]BBN12449.1 hypothetical protein Mp_5g20150 [Marchantia polymorpha subsp. ruderalis]|eukprot:PTQ27616.1 hypothetical protein MARPO_0190s0011 [Marchantia polymorpha]
MTTLELFLSNTTLHDADDCHWGFKEERTDYLPLYQQASAVKKKIFVRKDFPEVGSTTAELVRCLLPCISHQLHF